MIFKFCLYTYADYTTLPLIALPR